MPTLNLADLKEGLKRLLPVIETVARLTPNKFDDAAVMFVKALLAASDEKATAMMAELK
jgi:hypothetical protein